MSLSFQQIIERLEIFWSNPHDWPPYQVVADLAIGLAKALKPVFQSGVSKGNIGFSHLSAKKNLIFGTENHVAKDGWYHLRISTEPKTLVSKVIPCPLVARGSPFLVFSGKRLFKLGIFSGRNFFNQNDGRFRHPVLAAKFLNR